LAICFLTFLLLFSLFNIALPKEAVGKLLWGESTFSEFANAIHEEYVSDHLKAKHVFINLNGLFARVTGRRVYNNAVLLKNGMLTLSESPVQMDDMGEGVAEFSRFVEECGGRFLYVQAPGKMDKEKKLLPEGVDSYCNEEADELLEKLRASQVNTLDLRPYLSETPEQIEEHFFVTDHHWNYTGAFVGFQKVTEEISQLFPRRNIDLSHTRWDQWESHTIADHFLGSIGKRVGVYFGGVDDLTYYTPKFKTEISCAVPKYRDLFKGDFAASNMRQTFLDKRDYFGMNAYCAYIGGDYPLVQHRNANAPSDLKILIIKDSFVLPVQSYLSTIFQEIDVIDPRHYTESTLAEYVSWTRPDLVMMLINPSQFGSQKYYDFGEEEFLQRIEKGRGEQSVLNNEDIHLEPKDASYNFVRTPLEYGKEYMLTFDDVDFTAGGTDGVTTALYNETTDALLAIKVYDIAYCQEKGGFQWVFRTPESGSDQLQLLFYAGTHNHNQNNGVTYAGVSLNAINY